MEDNLSESQQEKVFQVMEVCNLETEQAIALLKRCGFDMEVLQCLKQNAIQTHFNQGARSSDPPPRAPVNQPIFDPMQEEPPVNYADFDEGEEEQDEQYVRYRNYKNSGVTFQQKYGVTRSLGQKIKGFLPSFLRNQTPGGEHFVNRLADVYGRGTNKLKVRSGTFLDNVWEITKERFPLLVLVTNFEEKSKQILHKIINDESWTSHLNTCFRLLGLDSRSYDFEPALARFIDKATDVPCLAMFRIDICEELHMMDKIRIEPGMDLTEVRKKLNISKSMCIRAEMNESVYEKKYYGLITGTYVKPQMTFDKKLRLKEERRLKQQQEEEFMISNQLHQEKKKEEKVEVNKEKEIAEKLVKANQRRKQLRQNLKEFSSGVNFKLRLPDGSSVIRTVDPKENVEYLFTFVETLEEGGFDNDHDRKFEIVRPYDRLVLSENRNRTIGEVFGEEGSQNLMVNEL